MTKSDSDGIKKNLHRASNGVGKKRVLVTGATGFIGRQSLFPLLERGYEVHALYNKNPIESGPRMRWHQADLLDASAVAKMCAEIQASHLLHFAWYVNPKDYKNSPENRRWIEATLSLLRTFKESGGSRAVLAGTCMEYDWTMPQERLHEETSIAPSTLYGEAKNETRLRAEKYAEEYGLSMAWGRIFFLYGPHEAPERFVSYIIRSLLSGEPALCSSGEHVRDYSFVGDIAEAFAALLDCDVEGAINVGSGTGTVLKELASTIGDLLGKRDLIKLGARPTAQSEPLRVVADTKRLTNEVLWRPHTSLEEGLRSTIEYWKNRN